MSNVSNQIDKLSPVWNIRCPSESAWVARDAQFNAIRESLESTHACALTPEISDSPGIGLSTLTSEYAYAHVDRWVDASNEIVHTIQYTQLCMALEILQGETKRRFFSVDETKKVLESHTGWLIIFDNAPDTKMVQDLLLKTMSGHIIVTLPNAPDPEE